MINTLFELKLDSFDIQFIGPTIDWITPWDGSRLGQNRNRIYGRSLGRYLHLY